MYEPNGYSHPNFLEPLERQGFVVLRQAIGEAQVSELLKFCSARFDSESQTAVAHSRTGHVVAARNVLDVLPELNDVWRHGHIADFLRRVLGAESGLVRVLYFDKPPERSWGLPWHKDQAIAVRDNSPPSQYFSRPTLKAGVPHVIAPDELLRKMLTLRIHLDEVTDENGPLRVVPESHLSSQSEGIGLGCQETILAQPGDALAMRPLVTHSSGASQPGTTRHRRIVHLEFAASSTLPDGFHWHRFIPLVETNVV
jgi:hypothetical protein